MAETGIANMELLSRNQKEILGNSSSLVEGVDDAHLAASKGSTNFLPLLRYCICKSKKKCLTTLIFPFTRTMRDKMLLNFQSHSNTRWQ